MLTPSKFSLMRALFWLWMIFAIIHIPSGAVEEYREADNAAAALAGFLEVLSYNPADYEAQDATGVNRRKRQMWDGTRFVELPPEIDERKLRRKEAKRKFKTGEPLTDADIDLLFGED